MAIAALFLASLTWRLMVSGFGAMAGLFLFLSILFIFYVFNYRTLIIRISEEGLLLKFGVFRWNVPWSAVAEANPDNSSLWRIFGAGIHFSIIGGRYRAMLNFLDHPRIVVKLRENRGLVRDLAFSTGRPDEILRIVKNEIAGQHRD